MAVAAWYLVKRSRSPRTPICVRVSMAASTSGGNDMFSMTKRGSSRPRCLRSSLMMTASRSAISFWCAARSSTATPDVARALTTRVTTDWRMNSCDLVGA